MTTEARVMRTVSHGSRDPLGFALFTGVTTVVVWLEVVYVPVETARLEPLCGVVQPELEEALLSAVVGVGVELKAVLFPAVVGVGVKLMTVLVPAAVRVGVELMVVMVPTVVGVGLELMVLLVPFVVGMGVE